MEVRRRRLHKRRMALISCMESNQLGLIEQQGLIVQLGLVDQWGRTMEDTLHECLMERKTTQPGLLLTAGW